MANNSYLSLLPEFIALIQVCSTDRPSKIHITHHIKTTSAPISALLAKQLELGQFLKLALTSSLLAHCT